MATQARRDADRIAKEAKTGSLIAFFAMLYLPMTSVAVRLWRLTRKRRNLWVRFLTHPALVIQTIFAMPIFNFQNDWRDWRYQQVPAAGPSTDRPSESDSTEVQAPVFSGYFWIYLIVSISLTFVTIEGWWRFSGAKSESRLRHWAFYPMWLLVERCL